MTRTTSAASISTPMKVISFGSRCELCILVICSFQWLVTGLSFSCLFNQQCWFSTWACRSITLVLKYTWKNENSKKNQRKPLINECPLSTTDWHATANNERTSSIYKIIQILPVDRSCRFKVLSAAHQPNGEIAFFRGIYHFTSEKLENAMKEWAKTMTDINRSINFQQQRLGQLWCCWRYANRFTQHDEIFHIILIVCVAFVRIW